MNPKEALFKSVDDSRTFNNICDSYSLKSKSVLDIGCDHGQYLKNFGKGSVGITIAIDEVIFGKNNNLDITK